MKIGVIIGSIRQGRVTERVAKWVASEASRLAGVDVEVIDLAKYPMPFFDESISPQYNPGRKPRPEVQKFLDVLGAMDAIVIVTPEYNRSYSAVLKNALDYVDYQLEKKPVALVAHGSTGGAQAVSHLRGVVAGVLAVTVPKSTYVMGASEILDESGLLDGEVGAQPHGPAFSLRATLGDLVWYANALKSGK